jgi:hypothetical protein
MSLMASERVAGFRQRVDDMVGSHPVVVANPYTKWFASGAASLDDVRHLTVQFSVFSHEFVVAQLRKVLNAADLATYRAGKEILLNELGVVFKPASATATIDSTATEAEPDLVATEGTVDGGRFRFQAAHFEWLLRFADPIGLGFNDLGKRRLATPPTLFFCDELLRLYGSEDPVAAEGASYAVEHWAAAGFWKELIAGLETVREREGLSYPLSFWTWHDRVEDQHAAHTSDELEAAYAMDGFDEDRFLAAGAEMLDGVLVFWNGLSRDRVAAL